MTETATQAGAQREIGDILARIKVMQPERLEMMEKAKPSVNVIEKLAKAGFPQRHRENLKAMSGPGLDKARELLPRVLAGDCLLLLYGDRGPGKTQMATWWAARRVLAGKPAGIYAKCADIFQDIKRTWDDGGKSIGTEFDILRRYQTTPFLVIDEVHEISGQKSDWAPRTLINILDHRYDDRKTTVLIANFGKEQLKAEINPSIQSRAVETGGMVHCDWPSYRVAKGGKE
jgi:DNA replication protein DnaC